MAKRDLRKRLVGHHGEGGGELASRDVNRSAHCERCGGKLDLSTIPMTGQIVEECQRCGTRRLVRRFMPVEDETGKQPPSGRYWLVQIAPAESALAHALLPVFQTLLEPNALITDREASELQRHRGRDAGVIGCALRGATFDDWRTG